MENIHQTIEKLLSQRADTIELARLLLRRLEMTISCMRTEKSLVIDINRLIRAYGKVHITTAVNFCRCGQDRLEALINRGWYGVGDNRRGYCVSTDRKIPSKPPPTVLYHGFKIERKGCQKFIVKS